MGLLLPFALVLLAAVLLSDIANRSILSTSAIFLVAGVVLGPGISGLLDLSEGDDLVRLLAETALVAVLFTDGLGLDLSALRRSWRLPGRALLLGMPLTFGLTALAARVVGLDWAAALLLAAVLAPTDPVFASALVGRKEIPLRLRRLLNVESGLNDGLALPAVLVFITVDGGQGVAAPTIIAELLGGILLGVAIPLVAVRLLKLPGLAITERYAALGPVALLLLAVGLAESTGANTFLAAFCCAATLGQVAPHARVAVLPALEPVGELLKLLAVLVFGVLLTPDVMGSVGLLGWLFVAWGLLVARPAPVYAVLAKGGLTRAERGAAAWFGPKGFASVVFALLVLDSSARESGRVYALAAVTIAASMLLHSMSDVPVAHRLTDIDEQESVGGQSARHEDEQKADPG